MLAQTKNQSLGYLKVIEYHKEMTSDFLPLMKITFVVLIKSGISKSTLRKFFDLGIRQSIDFIKVMFDVNKSVLHFCENHINSWEVYVYFVAIT